MTARDKALAAAVDQVLAGIADVTRFIDRLETIGGSIRLIAALRARLTAPPQVAGRPDPRLWGEATDRMVARR